MSRTKRLMKQSCGFALLVSFLTIMLTGTCLAQLQSTATLRGQITDEFGGAIVGATVTAADASGVEKTVVANDEGIYVFATLPPGLYTVRASAAGFTPYENTAVNVVPGRREPLDVRLAVALEQQEVTVAAESSGLDTDPANNADTTVLRSADLEALPDDPEDLAAALQALAGPSAGPSGGQIFIDGFTGGRLPPRDTIREVRINQNPFSAENDRPGGGRIEILTKPGTDKIRGTAFVNFNDEALNSRNPFAFNRDASGNAKRVPYQERNFGGNVSGPVIAKRASFFVDFERRDRDDNEIINATILDSAFTPTSLGLGVLTPRRNLSFSPRFDYQFNDSNTLVGRYTYSRTTDLTGIGNFNLAERAYNTANSQHTFQVTETAVLSQKVVNETRFQFVKERREQNGDNSIPTISVQEAFTGGGAQIGLSSNNENRFELQNYVRLALGLHSIVVGGRLRAVSFTDISPQNFGGNFIFAGGVAPVLDANNRPVGNETERITSIERYRRTLLFEQQGLTPAAIRALGGGPTQFSISGGNPEASVSQTDFGGFVQDDWRIRPNLTLNLGLRYETQNNISSRYNIAPRFGFAYSPGANANSRLKTVFRGGFGVFYDRFGENYTLQERRFNGINQQRYVVTDPAVLNSVVFGSDRVPNVPSTDTLRSFEQSQAVTRVADNLQTPHSIFAGFIFEQQLPKNFTLFTFINTIRSRHLLRTRNINAPLPGTFVPATTGSIGSQGVRPFGDIGEIYQIESSGTFNVNRMIVGVRNQLNRNISFNANYIFAKARSDVDGGFSFRGNFGTPNFPANSYDLSNEYGRANSDPRHSFFLISSINLPWGRIGLNPSITASTGSPFNITTGRDTNGDRQFAERPAFATDLTRPSVVTNRFGSFDTDPLPGQQIIPRNYGQGPGSFTVNLTVSRRFGFGTVPGATIAAAAPAARNPNTTSLQEGGGGRNRGGGGDGRGSRRAEGKQLGGDGGGRSGGRGPGGGGSGGGGPFAFGQGPGSGPEKRYNVTLSLQMRNLFNNVNLATPVGNLSSTFFGQSTSIVGGFFGSFGGGGGGGGGQGGNRTIQAQLRFSF